MSQFQQEFIAKAIEHYGLELNGESANATIAYWLQTYDRNWVVKATIEALYRGRYKVKSIDNILKDWQRRGSPFCKYPAEYERGIINSLPLQITQASLLSSALTRVSSEPINRTLAVTQAPTPLQQDVYSEEDAPSQHYARLLEASDFNDDLVEVVPADETPIANSSVETARLPILPFTNQTEADIQKKFEIEQRTVLPLESHLLHLLSAIFPQQQNSDDLDSAEI